MKHERLYLEFFFGARNLRSCICSKNKKAFQYDTYQPRYNKDEQWPGGYEADCEQNDTRLWKH